MGERLVDIHGQHAWQSLTRSDDVKALLDAYAGVSTEALRARWQDWRQARRALDEARQAQQTLAREQERLSWQIGELGKLAPAAGEWEDLNARHSRLSHAQALQDAVQGAIDALQEADSNAASLLSRALDLLQAQAQIEPRFEPIAEVLASALAQTEDAAHSLSAYARHAELDPQSLAELDERLALWMSLARRYRSAPAELPALLEGWKQELRRLDAAADLDSLERASQAAERAYRDEAKAVSKARAKAAPQLARAITAAMQGLAIAVTTSGLGQAQTLIFDEVDAGVGGAVAQTVGQLMKKLGRDRQVMAVTHLPQVAACADAHLLVSKESRGQSTASRVRPVDGPERVQEIARMLGGERLSDTTLAHAREMLGS